MKISKHYFVITIVLISLILNYIFFKEETYYWKINIAIILTHAVLLYIGVTRHRLNYFIESINSGVRTGISLTFDDGPNPEYTEQVLDILKQKNVKATFFIIGKNIKGNESILKRIDEEGHLIGNHSFGHVNWFNSMLPSKIKKELLKTNETISKVINKKPRFFRTPFGLTSPNVQRALKKTEFLSVGWDFRSFDTMSKDSSKLLKKLNDNVSYSSIILLHDNNNNTIEALGGFINHCFQNGIEIVPLDQMIGKKAYQKTI